MNELIMPFRPEFEELMTSGKKKMTTRLGRFGKVGDYFVAFGRTFIITKVENQSLQYVAENYFEGEGFDSKEKFIEAWNQIYPYHNYVPNQRVIVYHYDFANNIIKPHVHVRDIVNYWQGCKICGFDMRTMEEEL